MTSVSLDVTRRVVRIGAPVNRAVSVTRVNRVIVAFRHARDLTARADVLALTGLSNYGTTLEVIAKHVPAVLVTLRTGGYAAQGDLGGAVFKRGALNQGGITTADGATWTNISPIYTPQMFGAVPSTVDADGSNAAAFTTALAAAAADGKLLYIPKHSDGYSLGAPWLWVDGFNIVAETGTILWRDSAGAGIAQATIAQSNITQQISGFAQDIWLKSRDWGGGTGAAGVSWAINLKRSTLVRPKVLQFFRTNEFAGQPFIIGLEDSLVDAPFIDGGPDETGTGAFRPFRMLRSIVRDGWARCGDDVWQFVPQASPSSVIFDGEFEDSWYVNCYGRSTKGRIAILQIDETVSKSIKNCGWINTEGKCGNRGLVIESKSGFKYSCKIDRDGTDGVIGLSALSRRGFRPFQVGEVLTVTGSTDSSFNKDYTVSGVKNATTGVQSFVFDNAASTITWAGGTFTSLFAVGDYVQPFDTAGSALANHGVTFKITALTDTELTVSPAPQTATVAIAITANPTLYFQDSGDAGSATGSPSIRRKSPARFDGIDAEINVDQADDEGAAKQTMFLRGPGAIRDLNVTIANCRNVAALMDRGLEGYGAAHPWRIKMLDRPRAADQATFLIRDVYRAEMLMDVRAGAGVVGVFVGETPQEEDETQLEPVYADGVTFKGRIADVSGGQFAMNVARGTRINSEGLRPVEAAGEATRARGIRYDQASGHIIRPDFTGLPTTSHNDQMAFTAAAVVKVTEPVGMVLSGAAHGGAVTFTGSPMTLPVFPFWVIWRITGGTVTNTTVNGLTLSGGSAIEISVPPRAEVVVTYSAAPTARFVVIP